MVTNSVILAFLVDKYSVKKLIMTQQLFNLQLIDLITTFSESPFLTYGGPINFPHVENWQTLKVGIPSLMHVEF